MSYLPSPDQADPFPDQVAAEPCCGTAGGWQCSHPPSLPLASLLPSSPLLSLSDQSPNRRALWKMQHFLDFFLFRFSLSTVSSVHRTPFFFRGRSRRTSRACGWLLGPASWPVAAAEGPAWPAALPAPSGCWLCCACCCWVGATVVTVAPEPAVAVLVAIRMVFEALRLR